MIFIHCADLHLGSPFKSNDSKTSALRRREQWADIENLMLYIDMKKARIVFMSGDIFDNLYVSHATVATFFEKIGKKKNVTFIISPGNHDFISDDIAQNCYSGITLPENVRIFSKEEIEKIEFPELGLDVYGFAFKNQTMPIPPDFSEIKLNPSRISVLCCHGSLDMPSSPHSPLSSKELSEIGFDYVALGHIHACRLITAGKTRIAYPGCLEGRDFGEAGDKGVLCVSVTDYSFDVKFHKISVRSYETVSADVSGSESANDVVTKVSHELSGRFTTQSDILLRLSLQGSVSGNIDLPACFDLIRDRCLKGFCYSEIEDHTVPLISAEELEKDKSIRGCYYRALLPMLTSSDEETRIKASDALRLGLAALNGEELKL